MPIASTNQELINANVKLDPLVYWPCQETSGSVLEDYGPYKHDVTVTGTGFTLGVAQNPVGSGVSFQATAGNSAHAQIIDAVRFGHLHYTVNFWIRPLTKSDFNQIMLRMGISADLSNQWLVHANAANTGVYIGGDGGGGAQRFTSSQTLGAIDTTPNWTMITYTRDYADSGRAKVYINGSLIVNQTKTGGDAWDRISLFGSSTTNGVNGQAAHIAVFGRMLNATEVLSLYEGLPTAETPGPIEWIASGTMDADASTTTTPTYPTGLADGDILICQAVTRDGSATLSMDSPWQALPGDESKSAGTGVSGEETGTFFTKCFYLISDGTETGTTDVDSSQSNVVLAQIHQFRVTDPDYEFDDLVAVAGSDTSISMSDTTPGVSVASDNTVNVQAGDLVVALSAMNASDNAIMLFNPTMAVSGVTFANAHLRGWLGSKLGYNVAGWLSTFDATAGSATATATYGACMESNTYSVGSKEVAAVIVVLRAVESEPDPPVEYGDGNTFGAMVWSDGVEVNDDDVPYCEMIGDIKIKCGPYPVIGKGVPHTLDCLYYGSIDPATGRPRGMPEWIGLGDGTVNHQLNQQILIAYVGPYGDPDSDAPGDFAAQFDSDPDGPSYGEWLRVAFVGRQPEWKAAIPNREAADAVQLSYVGQDSKWLNERGHTAADASTGINDTLADMADSDAVSTSSNLFPTSGLWFVLDRPAQGNETNGAYAEKVCGGTGTGPAFDWDPDFFDDTELGAVMHFRPVIDSTDWRSTGTSRVTHNVITHAYAVGFPDIGVDYKAHPRRVIIEGSNSHEGSATDGGVPGSQPERITTFYDADAACDAVAQHTLNLTGRSHPKIFRLQIGLELYYRELIRTEVPTYEAEKICWDLMASRVGDLIEFQTETFDGGGSPAPFPDNSLYTDEFVTSATAPYAFGAQINLHRIIGYEKTYNRTDGWVLVYQLAPHNVDHLEGLD